jgi:hypothetical protein
MCDNVTIFYTPLIVLFHHACAHKVNVIDDFKYVMV